MYRNIFYSIFFFSLGSFFTFSTGMNDMNINLSCDDCNTVTGKVQLPEPDSQRLSSVSVSLEGADRFAYLNNEGVFVFHNVHSGIYIVNVNDHLYQYDQVLVEVTPTEVKAYQYHYKNGKGLKHKTPFEIMPAIRLKYEEDSPNILLSLVKSPYAIIIGITVMMFLCMQMVPQDQLKEQAEQMSKQYQQFGLFNS